MTSRYDDVDADWEEGEADPEGPQAADLVDEEAQGIATVPCPQCDRPIPDFADRCPYCGEWVVQGGKPGLSARGVLFIIIAVLVILALLLWTL
jgi:hypothetical protein